MNQLKSWRGLVAFFWLASSLLFHSQMKGRSEPAQQKKSSQRGAPTAIECGLLAAVALGASPSFYLFFSLSWLLRSLATPIKRKKTKKQIN